MFLSPPSSIVNDNDNYQQFSVIAQGSENVKKWKEVLCRNEYEYLLPQRTNQDEDAMCYYLELKEEEDTEEETSDDDNENEKNKKNRQNLTQQHNHL